MKVANPTEPRAEPDLRTDRIGRMLVEADLITPDQLEEALAFQQEKPDQRLGEVLIQKKFITDRNFYPILAKQLNLPYVGEIDPKGFDERVVGRIGINFAKRFKVLPLVFEGRGLCVLTSEPLEFEPLDDIAGIFGCPVRPAVSPPNFLLDTTNYVYDRAATQVGGEVENVTEKDELNAAEHDLEEITDLLDADDEAPIIRYVNQLLYQAVKERASDVHIEPHEKELVVRIRVDGILYLKGHPQKRFQSAIVSRVKVMANLNIAEKRLPQDGRIRIKIAGRDIDIRVSTLPAQYGEKVVMRLLDKTNILMDLEDIGIQKDKIVTIEKLIKKTHGIILVTGPTGSGKTTTLYGCLNKINHPEINITTVEDPVEYQLKGISQTQVNEKINLTFANGLRSILRQDPDVIMVGEIRDPETAEMAIQASMTGHLVFSTLHTNDSAGAIARLIDMNTEPFLISSTVIAIIAQRLVRTICKECVEAFDPVEFELNELGIKREKLKNGKAHRGKGCTTCGGTGYHGRTGIYEILLVNEIIQKMIMNRASSNELKKVAMQNGMLTLRQDGANKVILGITTIEEVMRVTQEESFEIL